MVANAGIGAGTATSHSSGSHPGFGIRGAFVGYTFGYTFDIGRQSEKKGEFQHLQICKKFHFAGDDLMC